MINEIKFEYLFESVKEDGRSIVKQIWTLDEIEKNEVTYDKSCLIARRQFTGCTDVNSVEIFDGDYMLDSHSGRYGEVKYLKGAFVVEFDNEIQDLYDWTYECVIGNKFLNRITRDMSFEERVNTYHKYLDTTHISNKYTLEYIMEYR